MAKIKEVIERWRKLHLDEDHTASSREEMVNLLLLDLNEYVKANGLTEADLAAELNDNPRTWVENAYARTVKP